MSATSTSWPTALAESASRELLASVIDQSQTCIAVLTGHELRFTLVNPAYQAIAPGTPLLGRSYTEVFPEAAATGSRSRFLHVLDTGEPWEVDRWHAPVPGRPDATWRGRVTRLPATPFEPPSALVVVDDVTAQLRAEEGLLREKEKYRSLFEHSLDAVYLTRRDGTILDANQAACRLHGMTLDELKQAGRAGLVVNDERHAAALAARAERGHVRAEMTVRRKDGTTLPVEVESVLLDPVLSDSAAFVISRDIAERKRAEAEMREAVVRYERQVRLFDGVAATTPDFVYLFDLEGRFIYANRRLLEVWGMRLEDTIGKTCRELGYERWHHDMHMREIAQVIETRRPIKGEVPFKAPRTGVFGVYEYIFTPVIGPNGEVEVIAGTTRDVTERKAAEEALRRSEAKLRAVFGALVEGVIFVNTRGEVEEANESVARRHGHTLSELTDPESDPRGRIVRPDGSPFPVEELPAIVAMREGRPVTDVEMGVPARDGTIRWRLVNAQPVYDERGTMLGAVASFFDITDRKRAEDALRDADRRKDEFLGMLSHELRNPLAPIRNALYILDHAEPNGPQARRAKEIATRQVAHLTRLVDDLLDVTRIARGKIELRRADLDLAALARRTAEDHRALMQDRGLELAVDAPAAPVIVNGDEVRLAQVLGNLLSNSTKFTPAGGRVTLGIRADGANAVVHVRDTGPGIAPEMIEAIFDPFTQATQTLARSEGGLGLGLALVKGLVALHGGAVAARSDGAGRGAEFVVTLPLVPAREDGVDVRAGSAGPGAAARRRRVLVVDDNRDAAETLAQLVEMLGHEVDVAYDGPSAVDLARARSPDLVLCDIGLPGMDGYEVARRVRAMSPERVRLIAVTGYAQPEDVARAIHAGFDGHLAKPPDPGQLADLLG